MITMVKVPVMINPEVSVKVYTPAQKTRRAAAEDGLKHCVDFCCTLVSCPNAFVLVLNVEGSLDLPKGACLV